VQKRLTDRDALCRLTDVGPRNHVLDGVEIGGIHSQPQEVTSRRCGLLPHYFRHLLLLLLFGMFQEKDEND